MENSSQMFGACRHYVRRGLSIMHLLILPKLIIFGQSQRRIKNRDLD
ncbi:hypothetical protein CIPAW_01G105800 [Carya illinoinensis]|uniref:Uncharacterized protein n=1 Tax=Carya illinoinensis TaxID=32201 RepID=A0A8T1RN62_CARIL|nr:hypothetical protein CIPAW_01G105800 [Carya illinoinensis]